MFKLILILIVINVAGSLLKKYQQRQREKRIQEGLEPAPSEETRIEEQQHQQEIYTDPSDLIRDIFSKLDETKKSEFQQPVAPTAMAQEPESSPPPEFTTGTMGRETLRPDWNPKPFETEEYNAKPYESKPTVFKEYDNNHYEGRRFDKIENGKGLVEQYEQENKRIIPPQRPDLEGGSSLAPDALTTENRINAPIAQKERITLHRSRLREAIIVAEIMAPPRAVNPLNYG